MSTLPESSWNFTDNREWREHLTNWPPVIITCAITGGIHGKAQAPYLPVTPEEQADSAYEAYKAGASMVHIHARDPKTGYETNATQASDFYKVNHLIRERCPDIIINDTGSSIFFYETEEEMSRFFAECKPEVASLDVGMLYMVNRLKAQPETRDMFIQEMKKHPFVLEVEEGEEGMLHVETLAPLGYSKTEKFARAMRKNGVKPEIEVFSSQSWWFVDNLIKKDLLTPPYWCQLVFGQEGACSPPTVMGAMEMINNMPPKSLFSVIGVSTLQIPINMTGLILGGHIRVGMEDNIYYRKGEMAVSNAQFVERAVRMVNEMNRTVATPQEAREMLGLSPEPRQYP
jgi:3-keto-5-aminohexanoate cleavage enzyme